MNKNLFKLLLGLLCLGWVATACDDDDKVDSYVYSTEEGTSNYVLVGYGHESFIYGDNVLNPFDLKAPIYIENTNLSGRAYSYATVNAERLEDVKDAPTEGYEALAPITENAVYVARYSDMNKSVYLKIRVVKIEGTQVTIEYKLLKEEIQPNGNANEVIDGDQTVTALEMPHRNTANPYVAHKVTVDGEEILNLAIEWNAAMRHSQWVAFAFNKVTGWDNGVGRADKVIADFVWPEDELLPEDMRVGEADHKSDGYDKGHLCASEDRQYSLDANKQTFYFSNMSPQMSNFNQGIWQKLEALVQSWGYSVSKGTFDNVYLTKGGTMNNLLKNFTGTKTAGDGIVPKTDANGFTPKGLACPAYYFMAILAEKNGQFQAIGFILPHNDTLDKTVDLKTCVVSIDELEEKTGLDFFCNLPNSIEDAVEASVDEAAWTWN